MRALWLLIPIAATWACSIPAAEPESSGSKPGFGARLERATLDSLRDPATWAPAAAAATVAAGGWDRKISEWAVANTPIFGSPERALRWSDDLRAASDVMMLSTAVAIPDPDAPWKSRAERILVEEGGAILSTSTTAVLKKATGRERPDGSDEESFPSGHASRAAAYAAATAGNLEELSLSPRARSWLEGSAYALAAGTGWARVEGGVHFPTDVLAGEALGNFLGRVVHDTFLGRAPNDAVWLAPEKGGIAVGWRHVFRP